MGVITSEPGSTLIGGAPGVRAVLVGVGGVLGEGVGVEVLLEGEEVGVVAVTGEVEPPFSAEEEEGGGVLLLAY